MLRGLLRELSYFLRAAARALRGAARRRGRAICGILTRMRDDALQHHRVAPFSSNLAVVLKLTLTNWRQTLDNASGMISGGRTSHLAVNLRSGFSDTTIRLAPAGRRARIDETNN